jgi:hypothetical protein
MKIKTNSKKSANTCTSKRDKNNYFFYSTITNNNEAVHTYPVKMNTCNKEKEMSMRNKEKPIRQQIFWAAINLTIGVIIIIISIIVISNYISSSNIKLKDPIHLISSFLAKLSISAVIIGVGLFFIRCYKKCLSYIRDAQKEFQYIESFEKIYLHPSITEECKIKLSKNLVELSTANNNIELKNKGSTSEFDSKEAENKIPNTIFNFMKKFPSLQTNQ